MSWDKTRAEYARKARSMPTEQTHVSVLAKDLEYLCEQAENGELAALSWLPGHVARSAKELHRQLASVGDVGRTDTAEKLLVVQLRRCLQDYFNDVAADAP